MELKPGAVILVVHRLPMPRRHLVDGLRAKGFRVAAGVHAAEALAQLPRTGLLFKRREQPQLMVLDPGTVNDDMLGALREQVPDAPIALDVDARMEPEALAREVTRTGAIAAAGRLELDRLLAAIASPSPAVTLAIAPERARGIAFHNEMKQIVADREAQFRAADWAGMLELPAHSLLEALVERAAANRKRHGGEANEIERALLDAWQFLEETRYATSWAFMFDHAFEEAAEIAPSLDQVGLSQFAEVIRQVDPLIDELGQLSDEAREKAEAIWKAVPLSQEAIGEALRTWLRDHPDAMDFTPVT